MKFHPTPLALALAAALGSLAALPATAALVTASGSFSGSVSVTDPEGGGETTTANATLGTASIAQFNSTTGVLMGTTLELSGSTRTQTIAVTAAGSGSSTTKQTSTGVGSSNARIEASGFQVDFGSINTSASCQAQDKKGCDATTAPAGVNTPLAATAVAAANLNDYVGAGSVTATAIVPTLSAEQTVAGFTGAESTEYSLAWKGLVTLTYDYLLHADASFDGTDQLTLNLDFGDVTQGVTPAALAFSIFNAVGDRVGLDLDDIDSSGDFSVLSTNLAIFSGLAQGGSNAFLAFFDTSGLGSFSASYLLTLSDADVGAASSRFNNFSLTLNLMGNVIAQQTNGVPEPATLALVGAGLFGMALGRRRRPG